MVAQRKDNDPERRKKQDAAEPELAPPVHDDARKVVDLPRTALSPDVAEGTEALAPHPSENPDIIELRGERYPRPRVGPMGQLQFWRLQEQVQNAERDFATYQQRGLSDEDAARRSGRTTAYIELFDFITEVVSDVIPKTVLWKLTNEEMVALQTQLAPSAGDAR